MEIVITKKDLHVTKQSAEKILEAEGAIHVDFGKGVKAASGNIDFFYSENELSLYPDDQSTLSFIKKSNKNLKLRSKIMEIIRGAEQTEYEI